MKRVSPTVESAIHAKKICVVTHNIVIEPSAAFAIGAPLEAMYVDELRRCSITTVAVPSPSDGLRALKSLSERGCSKVMADEATSGFLPEALCRKVRSNLGNGVSAVAYRGSHLQSLTLPAPAFDHWFDGDQYPWLVFGACWRLSIDSHVVL
jgi:hypothetical protein